MEQMKQLRQIKEEEILTICEYFHQPLLKFKVNENGEWDELGLEVQIQTTSTESGDKYNTYIRLYDNGTITVHYNESDWGNWHFLPINTLPVLDYLKKKRYEFNFKRLI